MAVNPIYQLWCHCSPVIFTILIMLSIYFLRPLAIVALEMIFLMYRIFAVEFFLHIHLHHSNNNNCIMIVCHWNQDRVHSIASQESYAINRSLSQTKKEGETSPVPPRAPRRPRSIGLDYIDHKDPDYQGWYRWRHSYIMEYRVVFDVNPFWFYYWAELNNFLPFP